MGEVGDPSVVQVGKEEGPMLPSGGGEVEEHSSDQGQAGDCSQTPPPLCLQQYEVETDGGSQMSASPLAEDPLAFPIPVEEGEHQSRVALKKLKYSPPAQLTL